MAENLSEITNDEKDVEAGSIATCRICLQLHDGVKDEGLISPCMCKGTQQFVHRSCLDQWRSVKGGFGFLHCTTCKAQFHLRVLGEGKSWRITKFILFAARNVVIAFLVLQTVIGILGGLAYLFNYKQGYLQDLFNDHWYHVLLRHPILVYYFGVLLCLIGMGSALEIARRRRGYIKVVAEPFYNIVEIVFIVCVLPGYLLCCSGDPVVAMAGPSTRYGQRELTKEYVVEDLKGCYSTPAKLDPVHMKRLKSLALL